ncbi:hypothetical protein AB0B94_31025 [Micromonospora sp. NPDC048986]|uniref:hypothetical protein n=1 Tax=Micromonospora sp. NPDC048986 TaxID=3155644 RepID=UPI0033CB1707
MSVVLVNFATRTLIPEDADMLSAEKVEHPHWCRQDECCAKYTGAGYHRRIIGQVGEVLVSVDQQYGEDGWASPAGVCVTSTGELPLTQEQVPLLAALVAEAGQFVWQLAVEAFAL